MTDPRPRTPGWYFARWIAAAPGTAHADYLVPGDGVECVLVQDMAQDGAPEFLNVWVAGVDMPQPIENFEWLGMPDMRDVLALVQGEASQPEPAAEDATEKPNAARALVEASERMREAKAKRKAPRRGLGSY